MKIFQLFFVVFVCPLLLSQEIFAKPNSPFDGALFRRSVFKIYVDSQEYQPKRPWKQTRTERSTGSGFFVGDGRIMTNAHVVSNAKYIALLRDGESEPMQAVVEFMGHDCDLAVIRPVDPQYLSGVKALPFGDLPKVQSPVATVGYARGGEQISITEGVVSRIGFRRYVHSGFFQHILIQVDSAINPGNSGGPVFQGDRVVGVAFQSNTSAENTGYVIPNLVIQRFLKDIADGHYDGHPDDGLTIMTNVTRAKGLRDLRGLKDRQFGVEIIRASPKGSGFGIIKAGDVILEVESHLVGSDGKISFGAERVDLNIIPDLRQIGEKVRYKILRDGKIMDVEVPVALFRPAYLPTNEYSRLPHFFVYGGYLFSALSRTLIQSWGSKWYEKAPLALRYAHFFANYDAQFDDSEELVIYLGKLAHRSNSQSSGNENTIVRAVNGVNVKSVKDMYEKIANAPNPLVRIDFFFDPEPLVVDRALASEAEDDIAKQYGIDPLRNLDALIDSAVTAKDLQ